MTNLINKEGIKEEIRKKYPGMSIANEYFEGLNERIKEELKKSWLRAISNKRRTLMKRDL